MIKLFVPLCCIKLIWIWWNPFRCRHLPSCNKTVNTGPILMLTSSRHNRNVRLKISGWLAWKLDLNSKTTKTLKRLFKWTLKGLFKLKRFSVLLVSFCGNLYMHWYSALRHILRYCLVTAWTQTVFFLVVVGVGFGIGIIQLALNLSMYIFLRIIYIMTTSIMLIRHIIIWLIKNFIYTTHIYHMNIVCIQKQLSVKTLTYQITGANIPMTGGGNCWYQMLS